uniref:DUF913 domain-containing protein n=1 Tax=Macrostomum lignano TaxID=282301 RepID=A0A1I8F973_9PLAT
MLLRSFIAQGGVSGDQHLGLAVLDSLISGTGGDHLVNFCFTCTGITNGLFMLNRVPKLEALVQRFTDDQLVQFTRILTLALSDGDQGAIGLEDCFSQAAARQPAASCDRRPMPTVAASAAMEIPRDSNLDCLLACPQFLLRELAHLDFDRALDNAIIAGSQPAGAPLHAAADLGFRRPCKAKTKYLAGGFGRPPAAPANQMPVSLFDSTVVVRFAPVQPVAQSGVACTY